MYRYKALKIKMVVKKKKGFLMAGQNRTEIDSEITWELQ